MRRSCTSRTPSRHMHIGSVGIFEGPPPGADEVRAAIAGQAAARAALPAEGPLRAAGARPAGVGRRPALQPRLPRAAHRAAVAGRRRRSCATSSGRVMSQQLDRAKPLWEMWIVEGLDDGRWALVSKMHHCMVDGVSGTDLLSVVLDSEREPEPPVPDAWKPAPEPNPAELVAHAIAERRRESVRGRARRARRPCAARAASSARRFRWRRGLANLAADARTADPPSSLNGPIGPHRRWDWARARWPTSSRFARALGGTVNDVVLTVITGGFRELLLSRGEVSRAGSSARWFPCRCAPSTSAARYNNQVSAMFAELPVGDRRSRRAARTRSTSRWSSSRSRIRRWRLSCSRR